jgi:hypothetical protein
MAMFSVQDVQDILRTLPPQGKKDLPQLVLSASGDGFVTGASLSRHFERLMMDGVFLASASEEC